MFIGPSQLKFKKNKKKKLNYNHFEKSQFINKFGQIGIQALESRRFTSNQLEAVRRAMRRGLNDRGIQIKINAFPFYSKTKKPLSSRMGKGKGKHSYWEAGVYAGKVLFELSKTNQSKAHVRLLNQSLKKLSLNARIINLYY